MTTPVNVPDSERNQTIFKMNQEDGISPTTLAAMFRLSPRTIHRILQKGGRPLVKQEPVKINVPKGALQADFKPSKPIALGLKRNPLYPGACARCCGTMEVDFQHREARCINCGFDPLMKRQPAVLDTNLCDGGGQDPWLAEIATKVFHCPECYRQVNLNRGKVPQHRRAE